ncbi:MAG: hypothetical protein HY290_22635, partial [Planctomycetia bacterium]|nr:hypothetical protein [Planctomycetia bacterium]
MYLNPFRDFVKKVVSTGVSRKRRRSSPSRARKSDRNSRGPAPFTVAAEMCEARTMLSGPALITVAPNTGGFITNGSLQTTAPTQLTFTFSPSTSIINTPANLSNISVTRAGADHNLGTADDQAVAAGSIVVDTQNPNIVTLRFANSLVNDTYQIKVAGTLNSSTGFFNSQQNQTINFSVDFGAQVVSVVPQPVVRTEQLKIGGNAQSLDGQTIAVSMGGGTTVTFQLKNSSTASVVPPANTGVVYDPGDSTTVVAGKLAAAINTAATTNGNPLFNTLATPVTNAGNQIALTGAAFTADVRLSAAGLNVSNAATITDLDTFTVTAQNGTVRTFQFKDNTTPSLITPGNVGITYNPGASAATLTTAILSALNDPAAFGAGFAVQNGNGVKFAGNPAVVLGTANASFLTLVGGAQVADGALVPKNDVITVYFSKTELVKSLAEDPAFYQVLNTTDGSILQPTSVKYDNVGNTAVLKFAADLPTATFHVTIGAPR